MRNISSMILPPAIISFVSVIPFISLELINRQNFNGNFPTVLFSFLWLLSLVFILVLMPVLNEVRAGKKSTNSFAGILLRVAILIFIAWLWGSVIIDQMPCFLGVPNCD